MTSGVGFGYKIRMHNNSSSISIAVLSGNSVLVELILFKT